MTALDLIARLEAATEGSRELDGRIEAHLRSDQFIKWDGAGAVIRHGSGTWNGLIGHIARNDIRSRTTSIDIAMTLVPEGSYGRVTPWFSNDPDNRWVKWDGCVLTPLWEKWTPFEDWFLDVEARAATPALALTIAALKAREAAR